MTLKQTLKKTVEGMLIPTLLFAGITLPMVPAIMERNKYNHLSNQEKIVYLENRLNSEFYQNPPLGPSPQIGGAMLLLWNEEKKYMQEELEKLNGGEGK